MITKFIQFNEGIKHLLVGPSEEEYLEFNKHLPLNILFDESLRNGISLGMKYVIEKDPNILNHFDIKHGNEFYLRKYVDSSNYGCVEFLLQHGANVHIWNDTLLLKSCMRRDIKMVKLLLYYGININDKLLGLIDEKIRFTDNANYMEYNKIYRDILELLKKYMNKK